MKQEIRRLPDSELEIMLAIWQAAGPVTSAYVGQQMQRHGWANTTVLNFLARLVDKGFLCREKQGKNNLYTPLIREEEYLRQESRSFLQRLYGNSVKNMVAALYHDRTINESDLQELREFLDAQGGKEGF